LFIRPLPPSHMCPNSIERRPNPFLTEPPSRSMARKPRRYILYNGMPCFVCDNNKSRADSSICSSCAGIADEASRTAPELCSRCDFFPMPCYTKASCNPEQRVSTLKVTSVRLVELSDDDMGMEQWMVAT
jgi:hypothetical protein